MKEKSSKSIRLNRYISISGFCSRRKADEYIKNNCVKINDKVITDFSFLVSESDIVLINNVKIIPNNKKYFLLNKPKNTISTVSDEKNRSTVLDLLSENDKFGIHPIGRLDRNTTGVLLLTNDGDLTFKLTHPSFNVSKVYLATLDKAISSSDIKLLKKGIILDNNIEKFDEINIIPNTNHMECIVEIHSGKNHFVKKMFAQLNYEIKKLDRLSFAFLNYEGLKRGDYRILSQREVNKLKSL